MEERLFYTWKVMSIVRDFEGWEQIHFLMTVIVFENLTGGRNWGISLLKVDSKYLFFYSQERNYESGYTE